MNIYVGQIYIEPGIKFEFSHIFQKYIHSVLSENIIESNIFQEKYYGYNLIFRMSAKKQITENEIKGPTIFKKDKDMEYSIFLPFDEIMKYENYNYWALKYLFNGIYTIFEKYNINHSIIKEQEERIIETILNDKKMFQSIE